MILKDNFYKICKIWRFSDNSFRVRAELSSEHNIYAGHFPGKPVVPGVCTLTIIKECLSEILKRKIEFVSIKECKYTAALLPEKGLYITIDMEISDSGKIEAVVMKEKNSQTVLKLKATTR